MATKKKTAKKQTYTVRIEWPVTYYCDTTVEATSPEDAARIAMEDPDYDNQCSYGGDCDGESTVEGVCEGDDYSYEDRIEIDAASDEPRVDHAYSRGSAMDAVLEVVRDWDDSDLAAFLAECHLGEVVQVGDEIRRRDAKTGKVEVIA